MNGGDIVIGQIRTCRNGGEFIIKDECIKNGRRYLDIEFIESGYKDSVRCDSIINGYVKDNLRPSFCSVGKIGYINTRQHMHEYRIWRNMISRCYNTSDKSYKYYGGAGVTVCERWKRFDWFVEDIRLISGYNHDDFNAGLLRLDKDISSKDHKTYSPETCMWVSEIENQKQRAKEYNSRHLKIAVFPDGTTERIENVSDFCRLHNLHRQNVNLCLAGKQKSTKGFRFYKEDV